MNKCKLTPEVLDQAIYENGLQATLEAFCITHKQAFNIMFRNQDLCYNQPEINWVQYNLKLERIMQEENINLNEAEERAMQIVTEGKRKDMYVFHYDKFIWDKPICQEDTPTDDIITICDEVLADILAFYTDLMGRVNHKHKTMLNPVTSKNREDCIQDAVLRFLRTGKTSDFAFTSHQYKKYDDDKRMLSLDELMENDSPQGKNNMLKGYI